MKALVFAAGMGTRLKPLTDTMPKALVPVLGKPLLAHVIEKLKSEGFDDITVNVHHFADQIEKYLSVNDFGVPVHISDERDLLRETGGGVRHARPFLEGSPFLVHNVDIISNINLRSLISAAREDALSTIVVSDRKTKRYFLFDESMRLVGWTNIETGEVRSPYKDLDVSACRKLAFSGIHYFSPKIFDVFDSMGCPERFPIVDFYLSVCDKYPIYGYVPGNLKMVDVGKFDSLSEAETLAGEIEFYVSPVMTTPPETFDSETKKLIFERLSSLGIPFSRVDTGDGTTMEACIPIGKALGAGVVKTVFLTNRQQTRFWLYVTEGDKPFVTRDFCSALGIPRVSFASEELLLSMLGTPHGATTILSLLNDPEGKVQLVIDRSIADSESFSCTDGTPFGFIRLSTSDLLNRYLPSTAHSPIVI